jgi:hypothetical protein
MAILYSLCPFGIVRKDHTQDHQWDDIRGSSPRSRKCEVSRLGRCKRRFSAQLHLTTHQHFVLTFSQVQTCHIGGGKGTCKVHGDLPGEVRKRILSFPTKRYPQQGKSDRRSSSRRTAIQVLNVLIPFGFHYLVHSIPGLAPARNAST